MSDKINDQIPDLNIERIVDGTGEGLILLEQESTGNIDRVAIHPIHLRYMAEKFGLVASSDPQAQRTIATLQRRLLMLNDRVAHLADYLANHSDHKHADLMYETTYARATADLGAEYCIEFEQEEAVSGTETHT
ncbi:hypothetical protein V0R37_15165 [Pollutimonas sp. H1-120]|uniref:hypothetical protein n=1 Tax=Pollutimonas sp. H1-120 TaxID=3148824 RepID=UPI003B51B9DC